MSSAYAMPVISSRAMSCEYGQVTGGGSAGTGFLTVPRLRLETSEGSEVRSVLGILSLEKMAGTEEVSVNGEGGVVGVL
jgi:hypothetical protein